MKNTPEDYKRKEVSKIFEKVLGSSQTKLAPLAIQISESYREGKDFTTTAFSFEQSPAKEDKKVVAIETVGKGFVDCIFSGLQNHFSTEYESLRKIKMIDLSVNPFWSSSQKSTATDATATVVYTLSGGPRGPATFKHSSRSVLKSGFCAALKSFQFYINCERSFSEIQTVIHDAEKRNRFDIVEGWRYYLSKLTEVNTYEKKRSKN